MTTNSVKGEDFEALALKDFTDEGALSEEELKYYLNLK